jgi:hypothetical protein
MRRLSLATPLLVLLILASTSCRIKKKSVVKAAEDDGQLVSVINVADPRGSAQLGRGFHNLENQSWRWTMKNFTATLRPPAGAAQKGAGLELKFTVPDVMFNRVGAMTVDARINGIDLGPQTYSNAGDYTYTRDIPASALISEAVAIDFAVDKGLPPGDSDPRELAIIVTSVGLISK